MKVVYDILLLIGSLGLFLFGMKTMSESFQKIAGDKMRTTLHAMASTPLKRVLTGFFVTAVLQSSSAVTVMVVSFVNAGLLTLTQSVGVIMGANIGTTITAWIIAFLGFKTGISLHLAAVLLIAVGFPLLMLQLRRHKSLGEFIIGIALWLIGFGLLKGELLPGKEPIQIIEALKHYTDFGFLSVLLFVAVGALLSALFQSSSATIALTMVLCYQGYLPFDIAVAMVIGENIGSTIAANRAARVANVQARRAARIHLLLNAIGLVWVLALFYPFTGLIAWIEQICGCTSPYISADSAIIGLALFHSLFNVCNVCLQVGFTPLLVKTVTRMVKIKNTDENDCRLKYIQHGMVSTDELLQEQARKEIIWYAKRATKQFGLLRDLFKETNAEKFDELFKKIEHDEEIADRMEIEIAGYLNKISEGELSEKSGRRLQAMYKAISEIESVSDSNYDLARIMMRKKNLGVWFDQDLRDRINNMFDLLEKAYICMNENLTKSDDTIINIGQVYEYEKQINEMRTYLKDEHIHNLEENKYKYVTGVIYIDIITECEKLGDYIVNVSETVLELKHGL